VDGFLFLDHFAHEAFAEEAVTARRLEAYVERFEKLPPSFTADQKYGIRDNRELMGELEIRESFRPLGRRAKVVWKEDCWFRKKQKERNRIEGSLDHGKEHYGLDRVRYSVKGDSEIWVRAGILAMNLRTAARRTQEITPRHKDKNMKGRHANK
jgi:hypothetical protein